MYVVWCVVLCCVVFCFVFAFFGGGYFIYELMYLLVLSLFIETGGVGGGQGWLFVGRVIWGGMGGLFGEG